SQCQAQPSAAITRGMWGAHRAALLLRTCLNAEKVKRGNTEPGKHDGAPAGTVVPADAIQGVLPI
ncbi:MAG: hypothetical protein WAO17_02855, partial [Candidatus Sulfotelmatobacter sp.]